MKLTKDQLNVLANKIYKELQESYINNRKNLEETWIQENQDLIEQTKTLNQCVIDALSLKLIDQVYVNYKTFSNAEKFIDYLIYDLAQKHVDYGKYTTHVSLKEVTNALILSTIDCESLEELIQKVKSNFYV